MKKEVKRVLFSVLTLSVVGLAVFASTNSWFFDTETSNDNYLRAGTLDLTINGGDVNVVTVGVDNIQPGDSGSGTSVLENVGTLDGELEASVTDVTNTACDAAGGVNDGTEFCDSTGDLGAEAEMAMYIDVDRSGTWNAGDVGLRSDSVTYDSSVALQYDFINNYDGEFWDDISGGTMSSGEQNDFVIEWRLPTSTGNIAQGDRVEWDIEFRLEQENED